MEVIWGHCWVCYQRTPGCPCVKWQWALLFWWGIFNFSKYLEKSWGMSPMRQVFREANKKNVWEKSWCHAIVLLDGYLDIVTHTAARFPPHSPSTAIQALNGLNHISPPDLQWLIETGLILLQRTGKIPSILQDMIHVSPWLSRHIRVKWKAWNRRQQLPEAWQALGRRAFQHQEKAGSITFPWVHSNSC